MTKTVTNLSRRGLLLSMAGVSFQLGSSRAHGATREINTLPELFNDIETRTGGRIGVAIADMETGRAAGHRVNERFAMCSSFKWLLAGLILQRVDAGQEQLDRLIRYDADDLIAYSPHSERSLESGMTIEALCSSTVRISDNTAGNLLLETMGGPDGFTQAVRNLGDRVTRIDRYEPDLNENLPGDPRDTTSPQAMLDTMNTVLFGDVLSGNSRDLLRTWMIAASTGRRRLRAGLPDNWIVGDKTGTSYSNQSNDLAFLWPEDNPNRKPILIVSYLNVADPTSRTTDAIHAEIAHSMVEEFDLI